MEIGNASREPIQPIVRTDRVGELLIEIPLDRLPPDDDGRRHISLRLTEPGFCAYRTLRRVKLDLGEPQVLRVVARRGATIRGHVVNEEGEPVTGEVALHRWSSDGAIPRLECVRRERTSSRGAFEIDCLEHELIETGGWVVLATSEDAGTAALTGVRIPLENPPEDLRLVAQGAGALRGVVCDSLGRAAAGLELSARLASLDRDAGVDGDLARSQIELEGGGRLRAETRTDAYGRFEVRGLRAAGYVLRTRLDAWSPWVALTPQPLHADGRDLQLTFTRPHLVVRLIDASGSPRTGDPIRDCGLLDPISSDYGLSSRWPEIATVLVFPASETGLATEASSLRGCALSQDQVAYELTPGSYLVGAMGKGFDGSFRRFDVDEVSGRIDVELTAVPDLELGTVQVGVFTNEGPARPQQGFGLYLEHVENAAVLVKRSRHDGPQPFRLEAPPGRYRLVAEGVVRTGSCSVASTQERPFGRIEREVTIRAGKSSSCELVLPSACARLRVELSGDAREEDEAATLDAYPYRKDEPDWIAERSRAAVLELHAIGRRPEVVSFLRERGGNLGARLFDRIALGSTETSETLPAGNYELIARLPGGREVRQPVALTSGETRRVAVRFE